MEPSSHFDGKIFLNPIPTKVGGDGNTGKMLAELFKKHPNRHPSKTPGPFPADLKKLNDLPKDTLRITWLGHSSLIIELDGKRILTDPVFRRASPVQFMGPKRFFPTPVTVDEMPYLDAIIISHDHFDHLDDKTIVALAKKGTPIYTSLGVGAILNKWGIPKSQITELDWWQAVDMGEGF